MTDKAWKQFERFICKLFGGERDWEHPAECRGTGVFAPEAKYRKKIPTWLVQMLEQAEQQAHDDQIGFVVLTEHNRPRMRSLVVLRLQDFYDWYVNGGPKEPLVDGSEDISLKEEEYGK